MSDTYDPVEYIRASQPANDALLAHWKSHPDYDPETVTVTISREDAENIMRGLPEASADFTFGRLALACRAALEGEQ